jgi:hypothetical protein
LALQEVSIAGVWKTSGEPMVSFVHPSLHSTEIIMKKAFKLSLLAAALTLSFGAMADEPPVVDAPVVVAPVGNSATAGLTSTAARDDVSSSSMSWFGAGEVMGEATATSSTTQSSTDNVSANSLNSANNARMESGAAEGATGNIGVNIAAGTGNLQGNSASIVSTAADDVFSTASTFARQTTLTNFAINLENSPNEAYLDAALAGASGNIGVNIAAGSGNTQSNQLAMIEVNSTRTARAATTIDQTATGNNGDASSSFRSLGSSNNAVIASGALAFAGGNIGVSVAAGVGNAQANALSVAVVAR